MTPDRYRRQTEEGRSEQQWRGDRPDNVCRARESFPVGLAPHPSKRDEPQLPQDSDRQGDYDGHAAKGRGDE